MWALHEAGEAGMVYSGGDDLRQDYRAHGTSLLRQRMSFQRVPRLRKCSARGRVGCLGN